MVTIKYEHVPSAAWRLLAVLGQSRNMVGASWPVSEACYTLAQAQLAAVNSMRDMNAFCRNTAERVAWCAGMAAAMNVPTL
jgi:predicted TIM-barrel fold metal-dependent hydrolase